jgi:RNA ligase (TIGR02306 family)
MNERIRKLATVRRIDAIQPIDGADAIECAVVGGWRVVVKKGEYAPGDLAVYCEIDSWIPHSLAPFLSKGQEPKEYNGVKGERLRTVRLRGQLSQGLLLPYNCHPKVLEMLADLEVVFGTRVAEEEAQEFDLSEILGIQKYEPPIPAQLAGEVRGLFPSEVPKTDQERIQNLVAKLAEWHTSDDTWEVTEKLDGTSCTFYLSGDCDFHACSRNLDLKYNLDTTFWKIEERYNIAKKMRDANLMGYAIQGEIIGEGIQGNPYKLKGQDFYVFDIYDADMGIYLAPEQRRQVVKELGLNHVPVISIDHDLKGAFDVATVLAWAEDKSRLSGAAEREGLVFKRNDGEASFKAISNKFLLKTGG